MKALITGIDGFVGPYLGELLLKKNYLTFGTFLNSKSDFFPENKQIQMDILDRKNINEVLKDAKPDIIFHLAGFSSVKESWENKDLTFRINVDGTRNIFDCVSELNLNPKIILISSSEVYGITKKTPINESDETKPYNPYGESKLEMENLIKKYPKSRVVIARSFNNIGPRQSDIFVCSSLAKQIIKMEKKNDSKIFVGNLSIKRDFTDVRDVVEAYRLLSEKGNDHQVYNVCSSNAVSIKDILNLLISFSKKKFEVVIDKKKFRKVDNPVIIGENSKIKEITNWAPKIDIKDSLGDIYRYWKTTLN